MPTLQELMEHRPDPRIGRVNDYLDRGKRLAQALYQGFLSSIPKPQSGDVLVDDQGNWHGGQLPEETAYNTLAWLMPTGSVSEAAQFAKEGFKPSTLRAITAYHGSPHKFDKFDMSKIGTGEGAQAYGHGLYFAESPEVADAYAKATTGTTGPANVAHRTIAAGQDPFEMLKLIYPGMPHQWYESAISNAKNIEGNLYKTSLEWPDPAREAADPLGPHHFLDWDKPLSEQPENIRRALMPQIVERNGGFYIDEPGNAGVWKFNSPDEAQRELNYMLKSRDYTGEIAHNRLAPGAEHQASEALKNMGIPGIRYLDQGSRGAGDGTYNYVVFDDQIPRITERNGVTLEDLFRR